MTHPQLPQPLPQPLPVPAFVLDSRDRLEATLRDIDDVCGKARVRCEVISDE